MKRLDYLAFVYTIFGFLGILILYNFPYAKVIEKQEIYNFNLTVHKDTLHIDRATRYNPTVAQCSSNPFSTADGSYIDNTKLLNQEIKWCALSRELIHCEFRQSLFSDTTLWRGPFSFGDTIIVVSESNPFINGKWVVHDCLAGRYKNSIDFLFHVHDMEQKFGVVKDVKIIY
jgi:hypothetical protein